MRVLVTGASGFIGSALLRRLIAAGRHTLVGSIRREESQPISGVLQVPVGDIDHNTDWRFALAGVNTVVHTASRVHIMNDSLTKPLAEYRRVNVEGTLRLARQAIESGVKRLVFISSIKVNGEKTFPNKPFTTTDKPSPVDAYSISKLEAETGLREVASSAGMDVVIIRPALVYGPGVAANFLSMMQWIQRGFPLPLAGIHNRRSMIAVDNLVDLVGSCLEHPRAANQLFLAADGEDFSTTELLKRTAAALSRPARLFWVPKWVLRGSGRVLGKQAHAERLLDSLQVDISQTQDILGWRPKISVDEGIERAATAFLRGNKC